MELQFYGANCVSVSGKGVRVVIDDNLAELGAKSVAKDGDVLLQTNPLVKLPPKISPRLLVDGPGEYEASDVSVYGIAARGHLDESGQKATIYKLVYNDLAVLFVGHIYPELNERQLEEIGEVDVMFVPVGGNGYTLDAEGALKLIKSIDPKLVVPTHYSDKDLKFEVPQQPLEQAIKELGMEPKEAIAKLKLKPGELSDVTQLVVLEASR